MRKPILTIFAVPGLVLALSLFSLNCHKVDIHNGDLDSIELITRAQAFFSNNILRQPGKYRSGNPHNDRTQGSREVLWASAAVMTFRGSPAVVVPLHFQKEVFLRTTRGGNHNFRLDNQEKLLVYQDSLHAWHAELVTTLPDTTYLSSVSQRFSG